jgi:molecular chaperone GrpE
MIESTFDKGKSNGFDKLGKKNIIDSMTKNDINNNEDLENLEDFSFEETAESGDEKSVKERLKDLREKLKEKTEEARANLDGWQRARAELVNKDKQLQNERVEIYKQASANILEELIPVLDSFELARKNKEAWEKVDANWRVGVEYIFQQLQNTTENAGLKKVEPKVGEAFDVNKMHAVEEVTTTDAKLDHTVQEVIQSGYELNGRLLREVKVKIYIQK